MKSALANNAEMFTPEKDVTETLEDGRTIQVAVKGVPMPVTEAKKLGLVKDETPKESESAGAKAKAPAENKAKAPKENK